jgi:hypothetical protein
MIDPNGSWISGGGWLEGCTLRTGLSARVINGRWVRMDKPRRLANVAQLQPSQEEAMAAEFNRRRGR